MARIKRPGKPIFGGRVGTLGGIGGGRGGSRGGSGGSRAQVKFKGEQIVKVGGNKPSIKGPGRGLKGKQPAKNVLSKSTKRKAANQAQEEAVFKKEMAEAGSRRTETDKMLIEGEQIINGLNQAAKALGL